VYEYFVFTAVKYGVSKKGNRIVEKKLEFLVGEDASPSNSLS
jgi:hypothetical protein